MLVDVVLGAVLLLLLVLVAWFYRYSHTEAFRRGELRRSTFEFLMIIGPFFGVHPKRPEPEPTAVTTPKGDDEDPNAERFRITSGEHHDDGGDASAR